MLTVFPASLYLLFESPVKMVVAGGIVQALLLPLAGFGTIYLHHRQLPAALRPWRGVTVGALAGDGGDGRGRRLRA